MLAPEIIARPGHLPPPRAGNVAYLANLTHIFFGNRGITDELRRTVHTLESYGGRLLPIIGLLWDGEENILAVEVEPLEDFREYFGTTLGLRLPRVFPLKSDDAPSPELVAAIRDTGTCFLDGFVIDEEVDALARETGTTLAGSEAGSRLGNNKYLLHHHLASAGEPVFDTVDAADTAGVAAAAAELARRGYPHAVVKSQIGASGIGLVRFDTHDPPEVPASHFVDGPCLVQGWIDDRTPGIERVASPSVQMLITDEEIYFYDLTDQILDSSSVHEGNAAPPRSFTSGDLTRELLRQASVSATWLVQQGYRGTASADFHLAFRDDGNVDVRVCELNARVTGATYPSFLARRFLPGGAWLMRNLLIPDAAGGARIFDDLAEAGLLFVPGATAGVLPINFNLTGERLVCKCQLLFLGPDHRAVDEVVERTLALRDLKFTRD
ncbi:MAG: hypothetical protein HKN82_15650 [Akkermansiaceae bacterium]|nr:hypothetical protein [Akkermansiaceae bacterium]